MDSDLNKFGLRLRALVEERKLSEEELLNALGISRATLFNWYKRDVPPPNEESREKLVALFSDQPRDYVLYGKSSSLRAIQHLSTGERHQSAYETPRRPMVAPLNPTPDASEISWERIRRYVDMLELLEIPPDEVLQVLAREFPVVRGHK